MNVPPETPKNRTMSGGLDEPIPRRVLPACPQTSRCVNPFFEVEHYQHVFFMCRRLPTRGAYWAIQYVPSICLELCLEQIVCPRRVVNRDIEWGYQCNGPIYE